MVVASVVALVSAAQAFSVVPDDAVLRDLARSDARVMASEIVCAPGGLGPRAEITVGERRYTCGGVECDGHGSALRMVRYDPLNPSRCRAEEGLHGMTAWESQVWLQRVAAATVAAAIFATAAWRLLAHRAAMRRYHASPEWQEYLRARDGEV